MHFLPSAELVCRTGTPPPHPSLLFPRLRAVELRYGGVERLGRKNNQSLDNLHISREQLHFFLKVDIGGKLLAYVHNVSGGVQILERGFVLRGTDTHAAMDGPLVRGDRPARAES